MVKDEILTWFLKNVYLPRLEIIDKPGFILVSSGKIALRDIAFPEYIFIELEKRIKGNILYSVGKTFGYNYALNTETPVIGNVERKKFLESFYFIVRYIESISYGRNLKHTLDYENKIFEMRANDFIICSKNGLGRTIMEGTIAGFCCYAFSDKSIEGVQLKCQGRGDSECRLICAPSSTLKQRGIKFASSKNIEDFSIDEKYLRINAERTTQFSKQSIKSLIDSGIFEYDHGTIDYNGERFFLCEASMMYCLETAIKKIKGAKKLLFDISFDWGKTVVSAELNGKSKLLSSGKDCEQFISDFVPALGWGDIQISKKSGRYEIISNYFPWTRMDRGVEYIMFRGILSGLLSGFLGRKVVFSKISTSLLQGYFSIAIKE